MRPHRTRVAYLLLALALTAAVSSCSQSPTAPLTGSPGASPLSSARWSEELPPSPQVEPVDSPVAALGATTTRTIQGIRGGVVQAGAFRVVFLPGAIRGSAEVTVSQPDLSRKEVDLEISPPSANAFRVPVLLIADCQEMSTPLLQIQTIYWWNPGTSRWQEVPGVTVSLLGRSVQAPLWHFSRYKVDGKAGW